MDMLLLGIYSCIPARGSEVRLLEFIPADEIQLDGKMTLKKFADNEKINLITTVNGKWIMLISQYKVTIWV